MTPLVKIGIIAACALLLIVGIATGRHIAFQDLKSAVEANEVRLNAAEDSLIKVKTSCDAILYGT